MKNNFIYFFLIDNIILLFINLVLNLNFGIFKNYKNIYIFKNVDLFFINITKKSFKQIGFYLNSKFNKRNLNNNKFKFFDIKIKEKKIINFYYVGYYESYYRDKVIKDITELLSNSFIFNFTSDNPDYLIYDVFSCDHLESKYNNSIKIAFFTENIFPDFKEADYSIGLNNINYLDRYFRKTTLIWIFQKRYLKIKNKFIEKIRRRAYRRKIRKKFCAAVISNFNSSDGFRLNFINELSKYKNVDMGGQYKNNVGGAITDKIKFLSHYKFSIAMENSEGNGYVSEKIIDSFMAGTIPIYYGGYTIEEFINPKSYILIKDENNMQKKIEYIKKIDNDEILYKSILNEKLFINDNLVRISNIEKAEFFKNIFEQEKDKAKRVDNYHFYN